MKNGLSFIVIFYLSMYATIAADSNFIEIKLNIDSCDTVDVELSSCFSEMAKEGKANIYAAVFYTDDYGKRYINVCEISPEAVAVNSRSIYGIMREQGKYFAIIVATSSMYTFVTSLFMTLDSCISLKELEEEQMAFRATKGNEFTQVDGDDQLVCYWGDDIPFTVYLKRINHKSVTDSRKQ